MDIDRLKRGASVDEPTVSASMATAALAYSGITVKMLVDKRLDAQLQTMFMVAYQPGAVAHPHDHPFEESYLMLEGDVDVVADGDALHAASGRRLLDRRRLRPRLLRDRGQHTSSGSRRARPARPTVIPTASPATGSTSRRSSATRPPSPPETRLATWKHRADDDRRAAAALGDRRAAAGGAPAKGHDRPRDRGPRRRLAEPHLADRARQGEPVGEHALVARDRARAADGRALLRRRGRRRPAARRAAARDGPITAPATGP